MTRDEAAEAYNATELDQAATEQDKNRAWRRFVLADRREQARLTMDPRTCNHLSHLPSGRCLGCGEQHQPLPDYKPGDDEALATDGGPDPLRSLEPRL